MLVMIISKLNTKSISKVGVLALASLLMFTACSNDSGSGKSTIIKLILKLIQSDEGKIIFENQEIDNQKKNLNKIR